MRRLRRRADGIDCQKKEAWRVRQDLSASLKKRHEVRFDAPAFALWPTPIFRWVEDDPVILPSAPDFTFHKAARILGDEAHRRVLHAGGIAVLKGLGNGLLAGIDMGHFGTCLCRMKAGDPRIGE